MAKSTKRTNAKKTAKKIAAKKTRVAKRTVEAASRAMFEVAGGITEERVRNRAYEIYCARGCRAGDPDHDWYQAEAELRNSR